MSQVFKYTSWVKRSPKEHYWTRCVGHITTQGNANNKELYFATVEDILKKWDAKTMYIHQLEITKGAAKGD